jgi:hypothetical protein
MSCAKHPDTSQVTITFCPACRGSKTSEKKAAAARENGKKGGKKKADAMPRHVRAFLDEVSALPAFYWGLC